MINVHKLCKSHGDRRVLRDVSARVSKGDTIAIVGPSGGGKSTLLRCLNALERFDSGEIEIAGSVLHAAPRALSRRDVTALRSRVGMVFQQFHLFPHLSVQQNVALAPRIVNGVVSHTADATALDILARVGLADRANAYPHELSGGQQQRVAIARALAMRPEAILFDEPTSALDPDMRDEVMQVIRDLSRQGMTMLVVTHEMFFARDIATRIWVLDQGTIVEDGPAAQVLTAPTSKTARDFFARLDRPSAQQLAPFRLS